MNSAENVRINFASGSPFEPIRGYSRAVQVGSALYISGTTAMNEKGDVYGLNDPYAQTHYVIERIRSILQQIDFRMADVVRTRMFVTALARWEDYARAHREAFEHIRPASSILQVGRLVDARLLVEMEVDAIQGVNEVKNVTLSISAAR